MDIVIKSTHHTNKHLFSKHCFQSCYDKLGSNTQIQSCKVFLKEFPGEVSSFKVDLYLKMQDTQMAHFHATSKSEIQAFDQCLRKATRFLNNGFETNAKKLLKLK